jgi:MoxR-like ATPase
MILRTLSNLLAVDRVTSFRRTVAKAQMFDKIVGYEGIKRTFLRSLNSREPVHILLVGPPGQAKTLFLKSILEEFGEKKAFFTVGGNASKAGIIDVLFEMRPKYLLVDEIEHLKPEYQTALLSLMETGIVTQTMHKKVRQTYLNLQQVMGPRNFQNPCLADSELCIWMDMISHCSTRYQLNSC